jgi:hypothetical protein
VEQLKANIYLQLALIMFLVHPFRMAWVTQRFDPVEPRSAPPSTEDRNDAHAAAMAWKHTPGKDLAAVSRVAMAAGAVPESGVLARPPATSVTSRRIAA